MHVHMCAYICVRFDLTNVGEKRGMMERALAPEAWVQSPISITPFP